MNVSTAIVYLRCWAAGRSGGVRPPPAHMVARPRRPRSWRRGRVIGGELTTSGGCLLPNVVGNGRGYSPLLTQTASEARIGVSHGVALGAYGKGLLLNQGGSSPGRSR